jgi:hypothetical protein
MRHAPLPGKSRKGLRLKILSEEIFPDGWIFGQITEEKVIHNPMIAPKNPQKYSTLPLRGRK